MSLPAKPPPPVVAAAASARAAKASASATEYRDFLARDAYAAGVTTPSLDDMARKLAYRVDDARHVLEIDGPAIDAAGLQLRVLHVPDPAGPAGDVLALEILNTTGADLAYTVSTSPLAGADCSNAPVMPFNAMTVGAGRHETRVECAWRVGIALAVTRVETLEVPPLSVWYLNHVPPSALGLEPRIARGHHVEAQTCALWTPQALRSGLERGEIGWRDLTDFYARHRCQTYHFPLGYRAFKEDGERSLPDASAGM